MSIHTTWVCNHCGETMHAGKQEASFTIALTVDLHAVFASKHDHQPICTKCLRTAMWRWAQHQETAP